jgi:hypothetical protein
MSYIGGWALRQPPNYTGAESLLGKKLDSNQDKNRQQRLFYSSYQSVGTGI